MLHVSALNVDHLQGARKFLARAAYASTCMVEIIIIIILLLLLLLRLNVNIPKIRIVVEMHPTKD
jgi:hypothetical protein